jgi:hypothetical protein
MIKISYEIFGKMYVSRVMITTIGKTELLGTTPVVLVSDHKPDLLARLSSICYRCGQI